MRFTHPVVGLVLWTQNYVAVESRITSTQKRMRNIVFLSQGKGAHTYTDRQIQVEIAKPIWDFTKEESALLRFWGCPFTCLSF